jgi:DNA-binding transcriptional MerR regulator
MVYRAGLLSYGSVYFDPNFLGRKFLLDSGAYSRLYTGNAKVGMAQAIQIGKASKSTGLSIDAIRFYQKAGLVRPPARTSSGYRVFSEADIDQLQFIGKAQELGFSLAEIKELLVVLRNQNGHACPEVHDLLNHKLKGVRQKIAALQHLETELTRALRKCERSLKGLADCCPVIDAMQGPTKRNMK